MLYCILIFHQTMFPKMKNYKKVKLLKSKLKMNTYNKKETQILKEISEFCIHECTNLDNCADEECILRRIEIIISGEKE